MANTKLDSIPRRAVEVFREEGPRELLYRSYLFGKHQSLRRLCAPFVVYHDEEIDALAASVETVYGPELVEKKYIEPPNSEIPPFLDNQDWQSESAPRKLYTFRNVEIIPSGRSDDAGYPSLLRIGNEYVDPSCLGTQSNRWYRSIRTFRENVGFGSAIRNSLQSRRRSRTLQRAFLLPAPYGSNYAKWHYCLCALRVYEEYVKSTGERPELIVTADETHWVRDSLSLLGFPPETYTRLESDPIRVDELLVPSYRPRKGRGENQPLADGLEWLSRRLLDGVSEGSSTYSDRLYISRRDNDRRRVFNEEEVVDLLKGYGFELIQPEKHSYEEQIAIFSNANILVGPHGSGFMNMIFGTDLTVVELVNRNHWRTSNFFIVANEMGFEYTCLCCDPVDGDLQERHKHLEVDVDELTRLLESVLGEV